ncbi:OsmC family protein [Roseisolibacter sp. H3M3-2]|uniref:OsmC family protein n=1 Tax=Roseisolibacter sp. H3M3-2 TaxID=3031323 RepID=UPI0023DB0362|nr:OsmC family protein [Roseisolibacter sp. H3M3-2]MDF1502873.1 OsmC family protein [Roseisolibacter sp. H3M3-2]
MKLTLLAEDRVRYELASGPMTVEAPTADTEFSPFHMLAGGLAACTYSTLASWAQNAKLSIADLAVEVSWTFAEQPHRVGEMAIALEWPSLPAARHEAARRAAALCTVHHTLKQPPSLTTELRAPAGAASAPAPAAASEAA